MILAMFFLFIVLVCATALIYYLYSFFIPALKFKKKDYNELLASDFDIDDDFKQKTSYKISSYEEKLDDIAFDSIYRAKIKDEKICIEFEPQSDSKDDETYEKSDDFNRKFEKNAEINSKCFKFWIYCYKLLERRKSAKTGQN